MPATHSSLIAHIADTFRLAAPIIVARAAVLMMIVVDTVMTGWAGAEELAAFGLGVAPQVTLLMIAIGFLQSVPILTAQAIGAGDARESGTILRAGMIHAAALGVMAVLLSTASAGFFRLTGQPEAIIGNAAAVSLGIAVGLPGMLLFVACNSFLEATGRPMTGMWIMIAVGVIDVPLNGILVLGWGGLVEPMGAFGAIVSSSVLRTIAFVVVLAILLRWEGRLGDPRGVVSALRRPFAPLRGVGSRVRRVGLPIGLAQGVESAAFTAMVFLGGLISTDALAAHQATLSVSAVIYMIAVGIAGATAIRVGHAVGQGSASAARLAGWSGIVLTGLCAFPFAVLFRAAPDWVASLFGLSGPASVVTAATIAIAGYVLILDAMMAGSLGALRGAGDVWTAFAIQSGAFWIAAVPLAAFLGLHYGFGAPGLIYGILAGVTISFLVLALRFDAISRVAPSRI